jgi:predicted metalloprotease with PDZ domain
MQRYPQVPGGPFSMYWFSSPPFDAPAVAASIESFYGFAARFFEDSGGTYRVFIRRNPFRGGGGTALRRSFMFGWGTGRTQTTSELQGLLAHEITHNWPRLDGADHGATAWYTEGALATRRRD